MNEPAAESVRNPYPGLRPFRVDEKHLFFGREQQVDRMVEKLAAHHFLAVVGGSGGGKSSLVNCGLRPALHRGNLASAGAAWRMAQMRPGSDPIGALARALAAPGVLFDQPLTGALSSEALVESTLRLGSLGLIDMVEQADLPEGTQMLVVADQFEELFRFRNMVRGSSPEGFGAAEDAVAFVRLLIEAAAQTEVPIYVVLTMRSDFLGDCSQFHGLPEAINEGQYLVPRLTRSEIRAAITGPAAVRGAKLSPVLVTRLLNDVGDNPDQLSILQHALNRTWFRWETNAQPGSELDLKQYEDAGGMADALDRHANKAFSEFNDPASQCLCERVFKALTDSGTDPRGIRRPTRLATLGEITGASREQLESVINVFRKPSRSFLMPPIGETLGPDSPIDISHESLMRVWRKLKTWAAEEAQSARTYRRLRETALEYENGQASLWRDPELRLVLDWHDKHAPTRAWARTYGGDFESAMTFLDKSRDQHDTELLNAGIEARWQSFWRWVPVLIVVVLFIGLQVWGASWIEAQLGANDNFLIRAVNEVGSHLLAGIPAALAYVILAAFIRKRFPAWEKRWHHGAPPNSPKNPRGSAACSLRPALAEPPADVDALGNASFGRRAAAQLVDWCVCLILIVPLLFFLGIAVQRAESAAIVSAPPASAVTATSDATPPRTGNTEVAFFYLGTIVVFYLYHLHCWTSKYQGTPGMRMAGIFVTDREGRKIGGLRATRRFFARWLSYYSMGIGFLMQLFSKNRQTLHDRLSGTLVLRRARKVGARVPPPLPSTD